MLHQNYAGVYVIIYLTLYPINIIKVCVHSNWALCFDHMYPFYDLN